MLAATTLEQSRKLIELGINIDTADMWYQHTGYSAKDGSLKPIYFPMIIRDNESEDDVPAWSTEALLNVLPKHIEKDYWYVPELYFRNDMWTLEYSAPHTNTWLSKTTSNTPFGAVYDMVMWCLSNGFISSNMVVSEEE